MTINGIQAQQSVALERRLNDLESRSVSLRGHSSTVPMNWSEFQQSDQAASVKPSRWSWRSPVKLTALIGGLIGGIVGLVGGALLLNAMSMTLGVAVIPVAGFIGMLAGGVIGGLIPNEEDSLEAKIVAYEKYLDQFEQSRSRAPSRHPEREDAVSSPRANLPRTPPVSIHR